MDRFFVALGWDVTHDQQTNPAEQEVKIERGVSVGAAQKRADYAFYLKPNYRDVRFYAEAKKPSVDLDTNADAHFQTVRYGWNSNTPLAVLTDFEQFHILDCRAIPNITTALKRIHKKFRFTDFKDKEKLAEVYWLFSREALASGAHDRYVADLPKPKATGKQMGLLRAGVQRVDEAFLSELEAHRETLAKSFKRENPELDGFELTEVTQRVLDRLVFLRFLEDKLIETEISVGEIANSPSPWASFVKESRRLDARYNGVVFKPHPLIDAPSKFAADEDDFKSVCHALSAKQSPYNFDVIPIHILGSIYERFLGKVITTTDKRAKVEEKPEVRKAGGVYYTPEYIVRYIVDQTVGAQIEGKTPEQIAKLRFADIACGSGSFLLGVFDVLLRYHTRWFNQNPERAEKAGCARTDEGGDGRIAWRLSLKQRQGILLNNVFGVDVDQQAVEVSQVSLYLKLLEDETTSSSNQYSLTFHEALLPSLNKNVVCGNSLIGTDILDGQMFPREEERALNAMDFEAAFPEVMRRGGKGGFDAVVGNPPYGAELYTHAQLYVRSIFTTASAVIDTFGLFIEKSIRLLKPSGLVAMIVPTGWYSGPKSSKLRRFFVTTTDPKIFVNLPYDVFKDAWIDTTVFVAQKRNEASDWPRSEQAAVRLKTFPKRHAIQEVSEFFDDVHEAEMTSWFAGGNDEFFTYSDTSTTEIMRKIASVTKPFSELADIQRGVTPFNLQSAKFHPNCRSAFDGTIRRYTIDYEPTKYVRYDETLAEFKPSRYFEGERLLLRELISRQFRLQAMFTNQDFVTNKSMQSILALKDGVSIKYLLGILNCCLTSWYFLTRSNVGQRDDFPKIVLKETRSLPIRPINFADPADKAQHDRLVQLVDDMLKAKQQLAAARSERDIDYYTRRCDQLEHEKVIEEINDSPVSKAAGSGVMRET
ncbi:MAG: N-6 DNA methylase [Anaerolineae bacterium]|nr:N-6 DNA methylase [Anaerolineae bacterium]